MADSRTMPRIIDDELGQIITGLPAIAIEGARGVGKTFTASRLASTIRQLDQAVQREILEANFDAINSDPPPVLIDEWQYLPEVWDQVRRAVDDGASPGRFLLTGSSSPESTGIHSGAGRIVSLRMRPMSLAEREPEEPSVSLSSMLRGESLAIKGKTGCKLDFYVDEILRSGFPGIRKLSGRPLELQLEGYLNSVVDRDFPELGHRVRNPAALRRWMSAYAAASSLTTSWEKIRDAASPGSADPQPRSTVLPYRDALERLWILDPVPAWSPSGRPLSRLVQAPKHQLADPALAATLLGTTAEKLTSGSPLGPKIPRDGSLLGALFESLVTQSVRVYAQATDAKVGHFRTVVGEREIDLIVERRDGRVIAIEVKLGPSVSDHDVRHLSWLKATLGDEVVDSFVLSTGSEAYRRKDGIAVVPAVLLGP